MKKIACEKCLGMLNANNCHLPCGFTGLEMRQLLYAYRCPDIPGAHQTTIDVQKRNLERFRILSGNCLFWGKTTMPSMLKEMLDKDKKKLFDYQ